jgi:hypothetical protein
MKEVFFFESVGSQKRKVSLYFSAGSRHFRLPSDMEAAEKPRPKGYSEDSPKS